MGTDYGATQYTFVTYIANIHKTPHEAVCIQRKVLISGPTVEFSFVKCESTLVYQYLIRRIFLSQLADDSQPLSRRDFGYI